MQVTATKEMVSFCLEKKKRFILKGRKNSTSSMVLYVTSPLPTLSVKQHVVQPGLAEIPARMSERVSAMIP